MQANLFSSYFMHSAFIDIYLPFQQLGPARLKRSPYLHFCLIFQNNIYNQFSLIPLTRCKNKIDFFEHPGLCTLFSHVSNNLMFNSSQQTAKRRQFQSRSVNHQQREQSADKPRWTNFKLIPTCHVCTGNRVFTHCFYNNAPWVRSHISDMDQN